MAYRRSCFECSRHGCHSLSPSDWELFSGRYYCNAHLHQLISGQRREGNKASFRVSTSPRHQGGRLDETWSSGFSS
ncbi:Zinc finger, LIM-type [Trema orientale]|uniref:Zinc finger, LIM-type n=1 Tax=Trema orientale TaxID=63057 RepID=A0A2P5EB75_TREOI|nr:Zinc finger, LIM-type [Trema orientale]